MSKKYIQCGALHYRPSDQYPYIENTGNLAIGQGVYRLNTSKKYFAMWQTLTEEECERIRENYDGILLACANFLNPAWNFDVVTNNLKRLAMPIIVLGLGAQCSTSNVKDLTLTKSNIDFANVISEHSVSIGVRGAFTAEVLKNIGIENTTVIGCPSYYITGDPNFKIHKEKDMNFKDLNFALNYTNVLNDHDKRILEAAYKYSKDIIGQMEYVEECWSKGWEYDKNNSVLMSSAPIKEITFKEAFTTDLDHVKSFCKEHFYQFYDVPQWINHMKKYHFVFGSRIHGSIISILAGVPAMIVTHDSRTQELAEFFNIPYILKKDIQEPLDMRKIFDRIDYSKFNREYASKFKNFEDFLQKNGMTL